MVHLTPRQSSAHSTATRAIPFETLSSTTVLVYLFAFLSQRVGNGPQIVLVPRGLTAISRVLRPVVSIAAHFRDGFFNWPLLIFNANVRGNNAGAIVTCRTMKENATFLRRS